MRLPSPRGPVSRAVIGYLGGADTLAPDELVSCVEASGGDVLLDEDLQLALWVAYELHYGGFDDLVQDAAEWDPDLLRVRAAIERRLEHRLRELTRDAVAAALGSGADVATRIFDQVAASDGPPLARFLQREASPAQFVEVLVHKSIYQLKEADPHTFAVPRIDGAAKVALVELQFDEYGAGWPARQHATLYGDGLEELGLDRAYGGYVEDVPAVTLALNNAMSLLCLHRRLRGAAVGHLAAVEVSSSLPCRKYVQGLRRLDLSPAMQGYFDEHVEADAVHEQIATRDICAALVADHPELAADVAFGVAVCLLTEERLADHLMDRFTQGASSLLADEPLGVSA